MAKRAPEVPDDLEIEQEAAQAFERALDEDEAEPLEQVLAQLSQAPGWMLADEQVLAREWLTPEEDEAWRDL